MYTLSVPPFVEVTIATTEEQMDSLRRQYAFVKPPLGGTSRSNLDDVLKQWSQQVVLADMRDPSLELSRLDGAGTLSASTITQAVGGIVDNFDGVTHQDDVFYLVYPPTNSRRAAGIRNTLQVVEGPETIEQEINGVLYRQKRPFTYWLATPGCSTHSRVKLAFYQSVFFQDEDGPNGWRLLKHSPTHPIQTWYVSPEEPALQGESTFAIADTFEIEGRSFAVFQDAVERSGMPIYDVTEHPNGIYEFPDYKAVIGTQSWAIEIVRPLSTIVPGRVIIMGTARTLQDISKAASHPGLGPSAIRDGLSKATRDKSDRRKHLAQDEKYCLLLVDTMGSIDPGDSEQWEHCELDAFDSVVVVQLVPERPNQVAVVKSGILIKSDLEFAE